MATPISIYVAGKWGDRVELQKKMDRLRDEFQFNVLSGWVERENRINTPEDYSECSKLDIEEVSAADKLLVFMDDPKYAYRGTYCEIGCAIGLGKQVVIVTDAVATKINETTYDFSHYCMKNVFFWHPNITHVKTIEEAVKELRK